MKKKFIILVACLLLLSTLITACGEKEKKPIAMTGGNTETSVETDAQTEADNLEYMILFENGKSKFDFIAAMPMTETSNFLGGAQQAKMFPLTEQKSEFYVSLLSLLGVEVGDSKAPKLLTTPSKNADRIAIYYGVSENAETQQVLDSVQLNEYGYRVDGNKIFIYGHTMEELNKAGAVFMTDLKKYMLKEDTVKTFRIPTTEVRNFTGNELAIMSVPKPEFGESDLFCESGLSGERMWVVKGCTTTDYGNYLNTLKNESFVEYETNEIEGNLFATYTKDDIIVDAWYTKDGYIRVNASKGYDARPLTADSYTPKGKGPALFMLGKAVEDGGGQECLVFRLSDGRFVIVDSAIPYSYADNIMAFLKAEAPDPNNIVVANWIFTHNHGDHVCGFDGLCRNIEKYKSILTVESFTFNFPGTEQGEVPWQNVGTSKLPGLVKQNFPNAKVYRALPGNTFKFADMEYEILASPEMYICESYPNNTCACNVYYRVTMGGQTINIPGDTSDFDHAKLIELYGDYLQCDILQAPHHGGAGSGTVEAAQKYKPKYILYCHSSGEGDLYGWDDLKNEPYNQQLIDPSKNPNYKEHFVMSDYVYYLPLPYSTGRYIRYTWADYGM